MDGERLHRIAGEFALSLPGSELTHPFGEAWDVVKVRGKIFALLTELPRTGIRRRGRRSAASMPLCHPAIT